MRSCLIAIACLVLLQMLLPAALPLARAAGEEFSSVEERRLLFSLRKERERLQVREKELLEKENELKTLAREVDKRIEEMEGLRKKLSGLLEEKKEIEEKRIREMGKMYEKMEPRKAAELMVRLDRELAIRILSGMRSKSAGEVLGNMSRKEAARLSKDYSSLDNP